MLIKVPLSLFINLMAKGDKKFLATHKTFGNFSVKKDLPYIDDGDIYHTLDVLSPVLNHENGITLFHIHGGAYVYGTKDDSRVFTSWFTNEGFKVVSINYRLMNDYDVDFVSQVNDVFAALNYVYDNRHELNININKFCLMGDSAGGHLALICDIIYHSKTAQEYYGIKKLPPIEIKCLGLNSAMYDFESLLPLAKKILSKRNVKKLFSKYCFDKDYMANNSPRKYVKEGVKLHPIFDSSSHHDYLNEQAIKLHNDAKEHNLDLEYLFENSPKKSIGHIYNHFVFDGEGLKCNKMMVNFFKKHCNIE